MGERLRPPSQGVVFVPPLGPRSVIFGGKFGKRNFAPTLGAPPPPLQGRGSSPSGEGLRPPPWAQLLGGVSSPWRGPQEGGLWPPSPLPWACPPGTPKAFSRISRSVMFQGFCMIDTQYCASLYNRKFSKISQFV